MVNAAGGLELADIAVVLESAGFNEIVVGLSVDGSVCCSCLLDDDDHLWFRFVAVVAIAVLVAENDGTDGGRSMNEDLMVDVIFSVVSISRSLLRG